MFCRLAVQFLSLVILWLQVGGAGEHDCMIGRLNDINCTLHQFFDQMVANSQCFCYGPDDDAMIFNEGVESLS